ncbi:monooxygenase [Shewanella sp. Choline-02u-19]|uniref:monooxygenase n=1 Tax=unclassified Shewanella TaxID=196818 RepID=UPI000C3221AD|nr:MULTISPECIES: monooxygenase [unclassified Shewanella]PKH59188.1 monooxygenase [Shewanella sp. Bg11-22]PKI27063.1 monooxygenase [Shewanella sp. Choline-02u-19]
MNTLLQVDFDYTGPFGDEMAAMLTDLAESINNEAGMIWKIWTENQQDKLGGGIYLFEDEITARAYLEMHSVRLNKMGIENIRGLVLAVNPLLSNINKGPIA